LVVLSNPLKFLHPRAVCIMQKTMGVVYLVVGLFQFASLIAFEVVFTITTTDYFAVYNESASSTTLLDLSPAAGILYDCTEIINGILMLAIGVLLIITGIHLFLILRRSGSAKRRPFPKISMAFLVRLPFLFSDVFSIMQWRQKQNLSFYIDAGGLLCHWSSHLPSTRVQHSHLCQERWHRQCFLFHQVHTHDAAALVDFHSSAFRFPPSTPCQKVFCFFFISSSSSSFSSSSSSFFFFFCCCFCCFFFGFINVYCFFPF